MGVVSVVSRPDTIFALSSGQDRAGVAIIRISGPQAQAAAFALARVVATPRVMHRVALSDPADGSRLDDALLVCFPRPKSFTGEDVVELHIHGGRAVVAGLLRALGRLAGCRLAEPGEFTRRAFENGKLDLTAAEGLADLIDAETEAQRHLALRQLSGTLFHAAETWRQDLIRAQALVEAAIDFSDESDVSERAMDDAVLLAMAVQSRLAAALDDGHKGEILRDGFRVVIAGPPNVGKSSLINAIAKREAAIVSAEAGTTRDVVELQLNLGGLAVRIADTAGLREATGVVEREGIRRALAHARDAHLVLWVVDGSAPETIIPVDFPASGAELLVVVNKSDLISAGELTALGRQIERPWLAVSTKTAVGIALLGEEIGQRARQRTSGGEAAVITNARHREHILAAKVALDAYLGFAKEDLELRAEDLRRAATAIGKLVGRVDTEEILGEIFGRFCIGK